MKLNLNISTVGKNDGSNYPVEVENATSLEDASHFVAEQLAGLDVLVFKHRHGRGFSLVPTRNITGVYVTEDRG